jgi:glycosyltransferase involved in cell wall biosynthesis
MTITFINRFFYPDHSATSQMLSDLAFALAKEGYPVRVITSRLCYDDPKARLQDFEILSNVEIVRIWTSGLGRSNLLKRMIDYLSFYVSLVSSLLYRIRPNDIVIAKTDPPMLSVIVAPVCYLKRAVHINWLQDIFPEILEESLQEIGVLKRTAIGLMKKLRNWTCRLAWTNVVIGSRMAEIVETWSEKPISTTEIPNWAIGDDIRPIERSSNALASTWGVNDAFVVGYSGNLGRAHDIETFLSGIGHLQPGGGELSHDTKPKIEWIIVGGGVQYDAMCSEVQKRALRNVQFRPYQARAELSFSLSVPDVHLISLLPELEGLIVPSKFFGIAAVGKPSIFVGDTNGEIARILLENDAGLVVAQGDGVGLASAIDYLIEHPEHRTRMGRNARALFEREFDLPIALGRWKAILEACENQQVSWR